MPRAPRQLPSLPPLNRAIQKPGANSPLDKIWGQGHQRKLVRQPQSGRLRQCLQGEIGEDRKNSIGFHRAVPSKMASTCLVRHQISVTYPIHPWWLPANEVPSERDKSSNATNITPQPIPYNPYGTIFTHHVRVIAGHSLISLEPAWVRNQQDLH